MITKRYFIIRTIYAAATVFVAVVINFLLPRMIPGNPAVTILLANYHYLPPGKLALLESEFGLNNSSMLYQFERYIIELLHGNLGLSFYYYPESVSQVILSHLPWTLFLLGTATTISSILGIIVGRMTGWKSGTKGESALSSIFIALTSLPYFWLAIIFQLVFAVMLVIDGVRIFPIGGAYSISINPSISLAFYLSVARHSLLPIITLVLTTFPGFALTMRNTMVNLNKEDYIVMAKARNMGVTSEL